MCDQSADVVIVVRQRRDQEVVMVIFKDLACFRGKNNKSGVIIRSGNFVLYVCYF